MQTDKFSFLTKMKIIQITILLSLIISTTNLSSLAEITKAILYPPPNEKKYEYIYKDKSPVDLIFYFQGCGCNEEVFFKTYRLGGLDLGKKQYRKNLVFVSFKNAPINHWSSPDATKETIKWIKLIEAKFNTRKVMLIGISMGGALALNVLSLADNNLQKKISNVIVVFPIVDYKYTLNHTKNKVIKESIKTHIFKSKDPIDFMKQSSPISYISKIPDLTKITLVEGKLDMDICSYPIEKYFKLLKNKNKDIELITWNTGHYIEQVSSKYEKLIKSFLN